MIALVEPSPVRAWLELVAFSLRRQLQARLMLFVALGLLLLALGLVGMQTMRTGWSSASRRVNYVTESGKAPKREDWDNKRVTSRTYQQISDQTLATGVLLAKVPMAGAIQTAYAGAQRALTERARVLNFTRGIMFSLFLGFLLPVWCLSFATEALGGERESRTIVWLLTRPLPRWSIYLAKYLALLPWVLGFTVGGFGLMCLVGGKPGREAFQLFWPAVAGGTMAFSALFHLFSAASRWPTVIGLVYCGFLETLLGDMPGLLKRASVSFYVRCLVFDAASDYGISPDKPSVYLPVSAAVAWTVLAAITVGALLIGMLVFSRTEYRDDA